MRKTLYVILFFAFGVNAHASMIMGKRHIHGPSCQVILGGPAHGSVSGMAAEEVVEPAPASTPAETRVLEVIKRVENLVDDAMLVGIFKTKEVNHLLEDLAALKEGKSPKVGQESFEFMMDEWVKFIALAEAQLKNFKTLPQEEQKRWKSKMELPLYFATGHFIVFLETRNKEFKYSKMNSLLKAMNAESARLSGGAAGSEKLFMFLFEKQVFRFFSAREFRKCKA